MTLVMKPRLSFSLLLSVCLLVLSSTQSLVAQTVLPTNVRAELLERGIDESELKRRLQAKGVDVDRMSQQDLLLAQPQIQATITEMEAENNKRPKTGFERDAVMNDTLPAPAGGGQTPGQGPTGTTPKVRDLREVGSKKPPAGSTEEEFEAERQRVIDTVQALANNKDPDEIYGHALFRNGSLSIFRTAENVAVPDSYRIGVDDQLAINIFGASQVDFLLRVDNEGFITPGNLQKIYVRGLSIGQARELVRRRLQQYYVFSSGQFNFSLDGSRTIRVNVFGEVIQSGTFTLSAVNGTLNALVAAGGVTRTGSVRRIQRTRGDNTVVIDVYKYLSDPSSVTDVLSLQNNDIVFVPLATTVVRVNGAVRRPMSYELIKGEGLEDLLRYSGGFAIGAYPQLVQIRRLVAGVLQVIDIDYSAQGKTRQVPLQDGDIVTVRNLTSQEIDEVAVEGAVELPGSFSYRDNITLGDIVEQARLRGDARRDTAFLRITNPDSSTTVRVVSLNGQDDDLVVQRGALLQVLSLSSFQDRGSISVTGAVRDPFTNFPFSNDSTLTVRSALLLAGGTTANTSGKAVLFRRNMANDQRTSFQFVDLTADGGSIRLLAFDSLVVYPREYFLQPFLVSLRGAVSRPGDFKYDPTLGLKELITLGGGFALGADMSNVDIFRVEIDGSKTVTRSATLELDSTYSPIGGKGEFFQLKPFDVVVVRMSSEFELIELVEVRGEVKYPGPYPIVPGQTRIADFVRAAGGFTSQAFPAGSTLLRSADNVGYIIVDANTVMENPSNYQNIELRDGDLFEIPKSRELVTIRQRATRSQIVRADSLFRGEEFSVAFRGPMWANRYINAHAGGFAQRANKKSVTVRLPNGDIRGTRSFLGIKFYPTVQAGSLILVENKPPKKEKPPRERVDWAAVATAITTALTASVTIVLLIRAID